MLLDLTDSEAHALRQALAKLAKQALAKQLDRIARYKSPGPSGAQWVNLAAKLASAAQLPQLAPLADLPMPAWPTPPPPLEQPQAPRPTPTPVQPPAPLERDPVQVWGACMKAGAAPLEQPATPPGFVLPIGGPSECDPDPAPPRLKVGRRELYDSDSEASPPRNP